MSYEPLIVIRKKDLETQRTDIQGNVDRLPGDERRFSFEQRAYNLLGKALRKPTLKFPEIELVLVETEGTEFNAKVRSVLDTLKIDYRLMQM